MSSNEIETKPDYKESFYSSFARRYAEVSHQFLQSVYKESSHPDLKGDVSLHRRLKELTNGKRGLDAGCGAGARDVYAFWKEDYDMWGIDAVQENIELVAELHPEIRDKVFVHDLRHPLSFEDNQFDFAMCNAVIQHIDPEDVFGTVIPELARVIRPNGVLQLMFKSGTGIDTIYDKDYEADRHFRLYEDKYILEAAESEGMSLIGEDEKAMGGVMNFVDPKNSRHSVMFLRNR
jgi:SAM-dependent methyltransferase